MMRPMMMRKVAFGVPAIALSAALACTMAGCGGTEGGQGGSDSNAPAGQTANGVQTAEVAGFTIESVGDGSYYRGAAEAAGRLLAAREDHEQQRVRKDAFRVQRACRRRHLRRGRCGVRRLRRPASQRRHKTQAVELGEGAQMDANAKIEPGQSVEFIYFWTTKDNYYGPITVSSTKERHGRHRPAHHALRHHRQGNRRL